MVGVKTIYMKKIMLFFAVVLLPGGAFAQLHSPKVLLWADATADFQRFSHKDSLIFYLPKSKDSETDIIIKVKLIITGEVLYLNAIASQMKEWDGFTKTELFDLLTEAIKQAHKLHLRIHASVNVFAAGHNQLNRGIGYTGSGLIPITRAKTKYSAMLDPDDEEVQQYELSILAGQITEHSKLYGCIPDTLRRDRCRFFC